MSNLRADKVGPSAGGTLRDLVTGVAGMWVNANGQGTVAIRGSRNVSSMVDHDVGAYTFNYTNAFADLGQGLAGQSGPSQGTYPANIWVNSSTVSSAYVVNLMPNVSYYDPSIIGLQAMGALA